MPRGVAFAVSSAVLLLAFVSAITGCTSRHEGTAELTFRAQPVAELSRLTPPAELLKTVTADSADRFCYGADYAAELDNHKASSSGTDLLLMPTWADGNASLDDLAYALYVFSLEGYSDSPQLSLRWQNPQPGATNCFIGIGNFDRNCWQWHAKPSTEALQLAEMAPYLDAEGRAAVAVAVASQGIYTLSWLRWGGNVAPVADLQADPPNGAPPLVVSFSASDSYDPDGTVAGFEWDLDGDGDYSETGPEADARDSATASCTYSEIGDCTLAVKVTDNDGLSDVATAEVSVAVSGEWVFVHLAERGWDPILAVIDGCPAIGYSDSNYDLRYTRSATATGSSASDWSEPVTVDTDTDCSYLVEVDGNPAIAYGTRDPCSVMYARSSTSTGTNEVDWSQRATIVTYGPGSAYPVMTVVAGHPAIAETGTVVTYVRAATSTGENPTDWSPPMEIYEGS